MRTTFVPLELARVDIDLIAATDPHSHKATAAQWHRTYEPHQLELSRGQKSKGTRDLSAPNLSPNSMFLLRESSDTHRHWCWHTEYCWILLFWTQITAPLTARDWHPFPILQGSFTSQLPTWLPESSQGQLLKPHQSRQSQHDLWMQSSSARKGLTVSAAEEILLQPGGFLMQGSILVQHFLLHEHILGIWGTPDTDNT